MPIKTQLDEQPTLNLTPMIDVVFLLIIFFMVATKFSELERRIRLRVPEVVSAGALTAPPEKWVVNVYEDGHLTLGRQDVTLEALADQLVSARREYPGLGVLIRSDGRGRFQRVAEVLAVCKGAGVAELGISVRLARREK